LIADRLGQFESSNNTATEVLAQTKMMFNLASDFDDAYLKRRIVEDSGDPVLLGLM
jgi:hypothetical protein